MVSLPNHAGCPIAPWCWWGDNGYAVLDLLHCCQALREPVTLIARLRLDAALYAPAPPRQPGQNGRPALKGARRPSLKSLLDQDHVPWTVAAVAWYDGATRIVELTSQTAVWYRSGKPPVTIRWVLIRDPQGAFHPPGPALHRPSGQTRRPRSWSGLSCAGNWKSPFRRCEPIWAWKPNVSGPTWPSPGTTPILLGLFSWTALAAHALQKHHPITQRTAAWYAKPSPTFVDAIALARRHLWLASEGFSLSAASTDTHELPATLYHRMVDSLAYAA